jgi:hypothetical protein
MGITLRLERATRCHVSKKRSCRPSPARSICSPAHPATPDEWQNAVDAAHAMLALESARLFGLVQGGPTVNVEHCTKLLALGRQRGIEPKPDATEQLVRELSGPVSSTK